MQFLEALATAFFRTFGITQPSDQMLRHASWFLLGMISLIALTFAAVLTIVFHSL